MPERHTHWKLIIGISLGVLLLLVFTIVIFAKNGNYQTQIISKGDLINQVDVTGEVVPAEEVDLSFTSSGRIDGVFVSEGSFVNKGDVLISLDASEIEANLRQAIADSSLREAELDALVGNSQNAGRYDSVKRESISLIEKAFGVADNQLKTNVDSLYENPQSVRPEVTYAITDYFERQTLNKDRRIIGSLLEDWSTFVNSITLSSISEADLEITLGNLYSFRTYLEDLSNSLSEAEVVTTVSDSKLTEFRSNINSARTSINTSIDEIIAVKEKMRNTVSDIPVKEAQISSSQASVDRYRALLSDYEIRAPFSGVVAEVSITNGEIVAANQLIVSLISESDLELEAFIPEVQISNLNVEDIAKVSFDAFGDSLLLDAEVVHIDARATEKDGVPTYKTILELDKEKSEQIRAGMTANIKIETLKISELIIIPQSAVKRENGEVYVEVLENGKAVKKEVQLGRKDTSGGIEVISGINVGQELIISKK